MFSTTNHFCVRSQRSRSVDRLLSATGDDSCRLMANRVKAASVNTQAALSPRNMSVLYPSKASLQYARGRVCGTYNECVYIRPWLLRVQRANTAGIPEGTRSIAHVRRSKRHVGMKHVVCLNVRRESAYWLAGLAAAASM